MVTSMPAAAVLPPGLLGTGELFQHLRDGTPRTRAELAQTTSLARSTITVRVDALLASGLLAPVGEAASTGGRPPTRFALNRQARVVLAIDLGASHASVAVTDLSGQVLVERTVASDIADGPQRVLDRAATIADELLDGLGRTAADVAGTGIGVPSTPRVVPRTRRSCRGGTTSTCRPCSVRGSPGRCSSTTMST
jgi:hypothetical protein